MHVLDTNVLSDILRGDRAEVALKYKQHEGACCTTSIALAEAYEGVYRPPRGKQPPAGAQDFYDEIAKGMPVLPFDLAAAQAYGKCCACLPDGTTVEFPDKATAAIVLAHDPSFVLVTDNTKHFEHFAGIGLKLDNWRS